MDTATTQSQDLGGTARRNARIGDIHIRAWYAGSAAAIEGIARILFAIAVGAQLAFESIGLLGRCWV